MLRILAWTALGLAVITGLFVALVLLAFKTYYLPSNSMAPTLHANDVVLVAKLAFASRKPEDGDIVVFTPPIPSANVFIKRIVAMPGESFGISGGIAHRNGRTLEESYVLEPTHYDFAIKDRAFFVDGERLTDAEANVPPASDWTAPDTLPKNCYILLGDNRNNSDDSHIWGCAQADGTFFSPVAGHPAGSMVRVLATYPQTKRKQPPP